MENTFLWFEIEIISLCKFKDFGDTCDVVIYVGACGDGDIIHVFLYLCTFSCPLFLDWSENPIHHCLKGGRGITETEEHHRWFP